MKVPFALLSRKKEKDSTAVISKRQAERKKKKEIKGVVSVSAYCHIFWESIHYCMHGFVD